MTIEQLLDFWAEWSARKDDNGLGYGRSRLGVLMAGGVAAGSGNSSLPYGIDENAVVLTVERHISKLRPPAKAIIKQEYFGRGCQKEKAAAVSALLGMVVSHDNYRQTLRRAVKKLEGNPEIAHLMKKMS